MTCPTCDGALKRKDVELELYGIRLGKYPVGVCKRCQDEWFE